MVPDHFIFLDKMCSIFYSTILPCSLSLPLCQVRRALGDFGVLISLACMVVLSLVMNKTYVQVSALHNPQIHVHILHVSGQCTT